MQYCVSNRLCYLARIRSVEYSTLRLYKQWLRCRMLHWPIYCTVQDILYNKYCTDTVCTVYSNTRDSSSSVEAGARWRSNILWYPMIRPVLYCTVASSWGRVKASATIIIIILCIYCVYYTVQYCTVLYYTASISYIHGGQRKRAVSYERELKCDQARLATTVHSTVLYCTLVQ